MAEREGLAITTIEGDMRRLEALNDASFDLLVHPVSNCFVPEVRPVWAGAFRVLRHGGALLAEFNNPDCYLFDWEESERGELVVRYALPYSHLESLPEAKRRIIEEQGWPLEWSHSLNDQIGGQLDAGFMLSGLYEDRTTGELLGRFMPAYVATRAVKP